MENLYGEDLYGQMRSLIACSYSQCDIEFMPMRSTKKYCSDTCRKAAFRQRNKAPKQPPKRYPRECSHCGKKYEAKRRPKPDEPGYGSDSCRSAAFRRRRKNVVITRSSFGPVPMDGPPVWDHDEENNDPCVECGNSKCRAWLTRQEIDEQGFWRATCSLCGTVNVAPPPGHEPSAENLSPAE